MLDDNDVDADEDKDADKDEDADKDADADADANEDADEDADAYADADTDANEDVDNNANVDTDVDVEEHGKADNDVNDGDADNLPNSFENDEMSMSSSSVSEGTVVPGTAYDIITAAGRRQTIARRVPALSLLDMDPVHEQWIVL